MRIVVCMKEVVDPLTPATDLVLDRERKKILGPPNVPPVINGFDEQALEAALRLKDNRQGSTDDNCQIVALSAGSRFNLDVVKRALAVGADELVLIQDAALDTWDSHFIARVLAAAIQHLSPVDLVLCGRQASDWDNAQVPLILAEMLKWPCLTLARRVEVEGTRVRVERVLSDGFQVMEGELPAVVTVTSELGELRYPTARARLLATRRQPRYVSLQELGVKADVSPVVEVLDLTLPMEERDCQFVEGTNGAEAGRRLAEILVGAGLIQPRALS